MNGTFTMHIALKQQIDRLLAFTGVLDKRLADIHGARRPRPLVREVCLLQRKSPLSTAYWQRSDQLHKQLGR